MPDWYSNTPSPFLPLMLKGRNPTDTVLEAPDPGRVGNYKTPATERKFSEFIDVQEVKEPLLRPSFQEGGAEVIDSIHKDKNLQMINRLMWQNFKNYTWEPNQEQDNPLFAMQLVEEAHRFASPLDGEAELEEKNLLAKMEIEKEDVGPPYRVSEELRHDADVDDFMIDVHPGPDVPKSGKAVQSMFRNVYLPSWNEIPEPSPWNQFTATEGTQIPDSYLQNPSKITSYDWPRYSYKNRFIFNR